ncbi:cupin domain-containing protein [Anaerovibrio sp.]|uniref:cupin domain-containing protein n=1 Tax=Anaerovibrio sp. TaxID=1872532 RepID=UPI003F165365
MKNVVLENIGRLSEVNDKLFEKERLGLTGMEISINNLAANQGNPFVHTHKQNEELYIVIKGDGLFYADGEEFAVQEGSLIRVEPEAERAIAAGADGMIYICIQAAKDSLKQYTMTDGCLTDSKASWM